MLFNPNWAYFKNSIFLHDFLNIFSKKFNEPGANYYLLSSLNDSSKLTSKCAS